MWKNIWATTKNKPAISNYNRLSLLLFFCSQNHSLVFEYLTFLSFKCLIIIYLGTQRHKKVIWHTCTYHLYLINVNILPSEKAMAPHSSTLAWKIPWAEEPGRLQSMGSQRVGEDWATSLSLFTFMHRRRKWQPTPVLLPGESQGWGSLLGCRLWGCTGLDTTEVT